MTDAEVICEFMESRPELPDCYSHLAMSPERWWALGAINGGGMKWFPLRMGYPLTLDALHEVEARLTGAQWREYQLTLNAHCMEWPTDKPNWWAIHASAEQKITALAAVLRENAGALDA